MFNALSDKVKPYHFLFSVSGGNGVPYNILGKPSLMQRPKKDLCKKRISGYECLIGQSKAIPLPVFGLWWKLRPIQYTW